ncbi:MAG: mechanosensitive ion channel family protein [Anaerolineaceae bacterium]|nr:mechanosensitive ion channel family protein [Anaerolineaceae bacterium]
MDLLEQWQALPQNTRDIIVRVALGVLVLVLVWLLRRGLTWLIIAPLRRLAKRSGGKWDDVLLDTIMTPARLLIIALGLAIGVQIIQLDTDTVTFVDHVIRMLIIMALFWAGYRLVDVLAPSSNRLFRITGLTIQERLLPFARTAAKLILLAIGLIIVIQEWGYDVSGLVAGLGLGGLAFSLAAQDTVSNLFGFTTIVGDTPFVVGEFIATPDVTGIVEHVGVRSTRIRQLDQGYVIVPNSKLANSVVTNWSRLRKRWINFTVGVTYDTTADQMETLLERLTEMLKARESVDPGSVQVLFDTFNSSSLDILIRCYIYLPDWLAWMQEKQQINLEIMRIVDDLGLSMAFPSRSVYIEAMPDRMSQITEEKP